MLVADKLREINTLRADKNTARREELNLGVKEKLHDEFRPLRQADLANAVNLAPPDLSKLFSVSRRSPSRLHIYVQLAVALAMRGEEAIEFLHTAGIYIEADYPAFTSYREIFDLPSNAKVETINALLLEAVGEANAWDSRDPTIAFVLDVDCRPIG